MDGCFAKPDESPAGSEALKNTLLELAKTRERIKRDREAMIQYWLDTMPVIGELEDLRSVFSRTKDRITMTTIAIESLETLLESTCRSIVTKQDKENKAEMAIQELNEANGRNRDEMKRLKLEIDDEMRATAKLKEALHVRRQALRTLQLTQAAVSMEIEAFNASVDVTLHQIEHIERGHKMVVISQEEYDTLSGKANGEIGQADWHVSSLEEKWHAAELRKANALERLEKFYTERQQKEIHVQGGMSMKAFGMGERETFRSTEATYNINKAKALLAHQNQPNETENSTATRTKSCRRNKVSKCGSNKITVRKQSLLTKIRNFLKSRLMRLFV